MYYPKYPEYMLLGLRLAARAKAINYVSILSYTPIYIEMAGELSDKRIKNVYFNPSVPPPGSGVDGISMRYKIYIEYYMIKDKKGKVK